MRTQEVLYVLLDILPIAFILLVGIISAPVIIVAVTKYGKFKEFGNFLISWLYGGHIITVRQDNILMNDIQIDAKELKPIHTFLLVNALTLATILAMVFCDSFVVKSDFGCSASLDCYVADESYYESPINCSDNVNQDDKIICYKFQLDIFQALADTGGILLAATIIAALATKVLICCGRSRCIRGSDYRLLYLYKGIFLAVSIVCMFAAFVGIHLTTHKHLTHFREAGHILKYIALTASFAMTTLTPWYKLINMEQIKHPEVNGNGEPEQTTVNGDGEPEQTAVNGNGKPEQTAVNENGESKHCEQPSNDGLDGSDEPLLRSRHDSH